MKYWILNKKKNVGWTELSVLDIENVLKKRINISYKYLYFHVNFESYSISDYGMLLFE